MRINSIHKLKWHVNVKWTNFFLSFLRLILFNFVQLKRYVWLRFNPDSVGGFVSICFFYFFNIILDWNVIFKNAIKLNRNVSIKFNPYVLTRILTLWNSKMVHMRAQICISDCTCQVQCAQIANRGSDPRMRKIFSPTTFPPVSNTYKRVVSMYPRSIACLHACK